MAAVANDPPLYGHNYHKHLPLPPYSKASLANRAPPPPYFAGIEIANLPPLPETPSELENDRQFLYAGNKPYNGEDSAYWEGQEVFSYYSPDNSEGAVLYFSGDEEDYERRCSPGEQQYLRYRSNLIIPEDSTPRSSMGSAGSAMNDGPSGSGKSKKNRRNSSGSDNGGFESAPVKTSLGVKEKLRSSLDKISLKPFRWSSSDKLTHGSSGSKSKSKNNRRYSDSGAAFAASNSPANPESGQKGHRSGSASCESDSRAQNGAKKGFWKNGAASRLIKPAYPSETSHSSYSEITQPKELSDTHDYVNLSSTSVKLVQGRQRPRATNDYQLPPTTQNQYYDLTRTVDAKDTAARAKGTWNMLKTAKTKQAPMKASGCHSSYASLGSSDTLQSSGGSQGNSNATDFASTPEVVVEAPVEVIEPPKLAPVSGKLLLDKVPAGTTILRPTAFKPLARCIRDTSSPPTHSSSSWDSQTSEELRLQAGCEDGVLDGKRSVSNESNHSDSGRHSATSIPVVSGGQGGSFSCSGSEGYASARVSSSTTHSAMHENDLNTSDVSLQMSPRAMCDDVMLRDLECRVRAKEGELEMLRRSFEDNEKALHMVYEDRGEVLSNDGGLKEDEVFELKQKYASDMRAQTAKILRQQQRLERDFLLAKDENKQLLLTNVELEERIKSMSDVIERQSQQQGVAAELRARLDDSESLIQHKNGEVAHLKRQLKEKQVELTQRTGETVALRTRNRELSAQLKRRENEAAQLCARLEERDHVVAELERRLEDALATPGGDRNYLAPLDRDRGSSRASEIDTDELLRRIGEIEEKNAAQAKQFEKERQQWAQEKSRVIRYQKQLQANYVQMYKRSQAMEDEIVMLTSQLHGEAPVGGSDVHSSSSLPGDLCYPMEI